MARKKKLLYIKNEMYNDFSIQPPSYHVQTLYNSNITKTKLPIGKGDYS